MARARKLRLSRKTVLWLTDYFLREAGMKLSVGNEPESIAAALHYVVTAGQLLAFVAGEEAEKAIRTALAELVALAGSAMLPGEYDEWYKIANLAKDSLYALLEEVKRE